MYNSIESTKTPIQHVHIYISLGMNQSNVLHRGCTGCDLVQYVNPWDEVSQWRTYIKSEYNEG